MIRFDRTLTVLALMAAGVTACDFPVASSKYRVAEGASGAPDDVQGWPEDLTPGVRTLVEAFAGNDGRCASAFARSCAGALEDCGDDPGCLDYGVCVRERAAPTSETTCSDDLRTSMEESWKFELVRHCWATRYAECDLGRNFDCLGDYGPPTGERTEVRVRQQLLIRGAEGARSDFSVAFCPEWTDCSAPLLEVDTEETTGLYDALLPVGGKNAGLGNYWQGYRLVRGASIPESVVATNVPIWGRRVEITRLLDSAQVETLSLWFGVHAELSAFVQSVDCHSDPAPGVSFDVPTSATAIIDYVDDAGNRVEGATVASGAARIGDYDPEEPQTIRALRDGETIAAWSGELSAGRPRYLRLHPAGSR